MTLPAFFQRHERNISSVIAGTGVLSVAFPVAWQTNSDLINALNFCAPLLGGCAFIWLVVGRFGRGLISRIALLMTGIPLYCLIVFLAINLSMSVIS